MSAPAERSGRMRRREDDEGDQQTAEAVDAQPNHPTVGSAMTTALSQANPSATLNQPSLPPPSAGVTPLPEQFSQRKKPRRSARLACHMDKLALVELQLVLQFLDATSTLKAARCSRRLMQAASSPFAWSAPAGVTVAVRSAADVQRICSSLLRFAPIHLRSFGMQSLQCVATVPHLMIIGLELTESSAELATSDLSQLLQHPNLARLQTLRLDSQTSFYLLTVDTMRLIALLPQLRTFDMAVFAAATPPAPLQPLADAPALTDLAVGFHWMAPSTAFMSAISGCAGLRRLSLRQLCLFSGHLIALCTSPNLPRLQHLELADCLVEPETYLDYEAIGAHEFQAFFSALQQLHSITLEAVGGVNVLLAHLHHAPALRLLSFRCVPDHFAFGSEDRRSPGRDELIALLAAAPRLEVRLLMPATLERWIALRPSAAAGYRAVFEHEWRELHNMGAELERVTIVDEALSD